MVQRQNLLPVGSLGEPAVRGARRAVPGAVPRQAIELAEQESIAYAGENDFEVLDMVEAYRISDGDEELGAGVEVFSKLHALDLPGSEFLDRYDSGPAHTQISE
ncbi:hypothetical protein ASE09_31970 [Streptomyces sp. Root66D1]|nr:hypothetical protein ASD33_32185 [Streptomyces sp. Root1304]KRA93503.1 hypothetical protein ASE09_31970 [Streptomyces sp. Root66D1]